MNRLLRTLGNTKNWGRKWKIAKDGCVFHSATYATHGVTSLREIPRDAATVSQKRSQECMVQLPSVQFLGV